MLHDHNSPSSDIHMSVQQHKSSSSAAAAAAAVIEIEVKATFIIVERNPGGAEDGLFVEAGRIISQVTHEFPLDDLINDGNGAVLDMLDSMRVPVQQQSMVEDIAATAVRLAEASRDGGRKVSRMKLEIEAVVNGVPDFGSTDDTDIEEDDEEGLAMTAEEVEESVVKTEVEAAGKECPICLDELVVGGGGAACMPCSHVFHELCIVTWLKKKKRCPCCRFDLCKLKKQV